MGKKGDISMRSIYTRLTPLVIFCFSITIQATKKPALMYGIYSIPADQHTPGEDTYAIIDNTYFGVFDGHKGDSVAQYLAQHLLELIKTRLEGLENAKDIKRAISTAFKKTDNHMRRDQTIKPLSGAPGAVVVHHRADVYVANVGSTRVFVLKKNSGRFWRSRNHTVNDPREEDRIIRERGTIRTDSSSTKVITDDCIENICKIHKRASRAFGDFYSVTNNGTSNGKTLLIKPKGLSVIPDIKKFHDRNIRAIFIVTDGIWRPYGDTDSNLAPLEALMKKLLHAQKEPEKIAKTIIEKTREKAHTENQKLDDMTALVILFN